MSLNAYGKRRGVSAEAVRKAIQTGRLERSVVMVETKGGRRLPKIADVELADQEWQANTRSLETEPDADAPDAEITLNEARRRKEIELWRQTRARRELDEVELAKKRGELIPVDEARATVIDAFTRVKTRLLGLPTRLRQRIQNLTTEDVRLADDLVREALEELADEDGDEGDG